MALVSSKRLGLDVKNNIELEVRLRRMEAELSRKADANLDATAFSGAADIVPQVTGLRKVGSNPGTVTVAWNPVTISDLRRYELQFAEDLGFTSNVQTENLASMRYYTVCESSGCKRGGDAGCLVCCSQYYDGTGADW
jgi:hypothetical protein